MKYLILFLALILSPGYLLASPNLKQLILSDCSAALKASSETAESELPELFDYLRRVLELSTDPEIPGIILM